MTNEDVATDNQQKITNVTGIVSNGTGSMTTKEIDTDNQQKKMSFLQGMLCIVGGCVGLLFICTFPCPHCVYCRMIIKEFIKRKLFHKGSNAASSEEGTMNYPPAYSLNSEYSTSVCSRYSSISFRSMCLQPISSGIMVSAE